MRKRKKLLLGCLPSLFYLLGFQVLPIQAQVESAETVDLEPVEVVALPETGVSGLEGALLRAPLPEASINYREAFSQIPALILQDSFGGFDPPRLSVRGSGVQSAPVSRGVQLWMDGFPLSFADGSFNLALLETSWGGSTSLIPGTAAGVPSLGGRLELTSAPSAMDRGGKLMASGGSWNTLLGSGWMATDEPVRVATAGAAYHTEGWRDRSRQNRQSAMVVVEQPGADENLWTGRVYASRSEIQVPGPLTRADANQNPRLVNPAVARDRPQRETDYAQAGLIWTSPRPDTKVELGGSGAYHRDRFQQLLPNGISSTSGWEGSAFGGISRYWHTGWEQETTMRALVQWGYRDAHRDRNQAGLAGARIGDDRLRALTLSPSIDHRVALPGPWRVDLGTSLLHARREIDDRIGSGPGRDSTDLDLSDTKLAPRVALYWEPDPRFSTFLGWSRSYEPPTFDDLLLTAGPMNARILQSAPLDWQKADTWEVGWKYRSDPVHWTTTVYYAEWDREFLRLLDEQGAARGTVNAGDTLRYGIETFLQVDLWRTDDVSWNIWASTQISRVRFDGDPVFGDNRIGGTPPITGAAGSELEWGGGWFVAPAWHWLAGTTYADHANRLSYGSYGIAALSGGYRHPRGWSLRVSVNNIFDRDYIASTAGVLDRATNPEATAIFLPGTGRSIEASLGCAW